MTDDDKLDLIIKMITENREETRSEFANVNDKLDTIITKIDDIGNRLGEIKQDLGIIKYNTFN